MIKYYPLNLDLRATLTFSKQQPAEHKTNYLILQLCKMSACTYAYTLIRCFLKIYV